MDQFRLYLRIFIIFLDHESRGKLYLPSALLLHHDLSDTVLSLQIPPIHEIGRQNAILLEPCNSTKI